MVYDDDMRELRREVERIKDRIDDIGHIQALQVRALGDVKELVLDYFSGRAGKNKALIYVAADGTKGVTEIADEVGVDQALVTRRCQEMHDLGLLGWEGVGNSKNYYKTVVERALRISSEVKQIAIDS